MTAIVLQTINKTHAYTSSRPSSPPAAAQAGTRRGRGSVLSPKRAHIHANPFANHTKQASHAVYCSIHLVKNWLHRKRFSYPALANCQSCCIENCHSNKNTTAWCCVLPECESRNPFVFFTFLRLPPDPLVVYTALVALEKYLGIAFGEIRKAINRYVASLVW